MASLGFVYGKDPYPMWFKEFSDQGNITYSEDMSSLTINNPKSVAEARIGDTLMYKDESIVVIPQAAMKKYSRR